MQLRQEKILCVSGACADHDVWVNLIVEIATFFSHLPPFINNVTLHFTVEVSSPMNCSISLVI